MRLKILVTFCFFWAYIAEAAALPIIQGVTGERETTIAIVSDEPLGSVVLTDSAGGQHVSSWVETATIPDNAPLVRTFYYNDLQKGGTFTLVVRNVAGKVIDQRTLRTFDLARTRARIAVASCMDDSYTKEQGQMWRDLLGHKPDALFLIGDNVYGDRRGKGKDQRSLPASPRTLWERYLETRRALELFKAEQLVPVFATWDDHDYGVNDAGRNHPFRAEAERIFRSFFPRTEITGVFEAGPGVSGIFQGFGQRFVFLDDRSFRSAKGEGDEAHFGNAQEQWLAHALASSARPTWLISGDQFFGGYHRYESYEGSHPKAFKTFTAWLQNVKSPLFFLSGDRHLAELMHISTAEIGQDAYELTSSAIHAKTYPDAWAEGKNPRQIAGASGTLNYAIIETTAEPSWKLDIAAFGPEKKQLFRNTVAPTGPKK